MHKKDGKATHFSLTVPFWWLSLLVWLLLSLLTRQPLHSVSSSEPVSAWSCWWRHLCNTSWHHQHTAHCETEEPQPCRIKRHWSENVDGAANYSHIYTLMTQVNEKERIQNSEDKCLFYSNTDAHHWHNQSINQHRTMDSHGRYPSPAVSLYPVRAACPLPSTVLDLNLYASGPHSRSAGVAGTWSLIPRVRCPSVGVQNKWSLVGSKSRRSSVGSMGRLFCWL